MQKKSYNGQTGIKLGVLYNKATTDTYEQLTDALKAEADCGCGIDCCAGELALPDQATNARTAIYVVDGVLKFKDGDGTVYTVTIVADE